MRTEKNIYFDTRLTLQKYGQTMERKHRFFVSFQYEINGEFKTFKGIVEEQ